MVFWILLSFSFFLTSPFVWREEERERRIQKTTWERDLWSPGDGLFPFVPFHRLVPKSFSFPFLSNPPVGR
jgi:hypothetical protein